MAESGRRKPSAERPQMDRMRRSSSYLSDHQQYRPPKPETYHGIDELVEGGRPSPLASSPKTLLPFRGVPQDGMPATIVESGVSHGLSHPNCAPPAGHKSDRLVATLFYRGSSSSSSAAGSPSASTRSAGLPESNDALPPNMAPTSNMDEFPLEPPTQESEQLDHIYGSYISPLCIASFLHLMSTFPQSRGAGEPHSSHRCLDNPETPRIVELTLSPTPTPDCLSLSDLRKHEMIYRFEQEWSVDVVLQPDLVWRRHPRLVVFDMDSTLITQEVIELMADTIKEPADLAARVAEITRRAMMGELEFEASFRERVALLKGVSATVFDDLRPVVDVTKGVPELIRALKRLGVKTAVLSGGFQPLTAWLAGQLDIDYAFANEVVVDEGKLTGEAKGKIVGKERKRDLLVEIAAKEGIHLSQAVAVGDGANDLLMLREAGLGVAWNAKPRVQMEADARLNSDSLLDLLYLFGFTAEEIQMLCTEV
ncbi:phosphoserine phosphatase [Metarhizium album ARSEF 1941]|uniref:phosphoserine phosphatase n=1 Tax=Metarhizium album (strain ARSEF 1941) TaxID=1081103 RepID=A0A0B2X4K4_METAS|nr:phosphoserine phosphatase [Metarhizium album ARSEF 1941]KHO00231.1 phosphoserine phosphatase [Metarhizium album ARSEF 1941]